MAKRRELRRLGTLSGHLHQALATAEAEAVLFHQSDGVATITLNRPDNMNSMTPDLLDAFTRCVERCKNDSNIRCVVITGNGKSFCAGADFKNPPGSFGGYEGYQSPWEKSRINTYGPFLSVRELRVPVIAAMSGHAIGGGLGLALVCDLRVADEAAMYGANFVRLGLHPGMATTYILPQLVGLPRAAELIFTGRLVSGMEAAQLGLASYAVPNGQVLGKAMELAREIASAAPLAVKWAKDSLVQHSAFDPRPAALLEAHMQSRTSETRDSKEGIKALLQKRLPIFEGR
mmetsp:Transcript_125318/g.348693  ORF Transcript_125318/g.348693 Transcript_125318/m.348693 type:complete len:289 (+) Transcript_125318:72-938(+)